MHVGGLTRDIAIEKPENCQENAKRPGLSAVGSATARRHVAFAGGFEGHIGFKCVSLFIQKRN